MILRNVFTLLTKKSKLNVKAEVAELVDAPDSKSGMGETM
jgi:hypothetical protein